MNNSTNSEHHKQQALALIQEYTDVQDEYTFELDKADPDDVHVDVYERHDDALADLAHRAIGLLDEMTR